MTINDPPQSDPQIVVAPVIPVPRPVAGHMDAALSSVGRAARKVALTTWEGIWYVLMCIFFGAGYFVKIPAKKALKDFGLTEMTGAEQFWYVLMCIFFGAGYFAKIPVAKALSELPQYKADRQVALGALR